MEQTGVFFDPKKDFSAPLALAASVEKGALPDESVKVDTSRLVVVGNSAFLENETLTEANVDFVLAALELDAEPRGVDRHRAEAGGAIHA